MPDSRLCISCACRIGVECTAGCSWAECGNYVDIENPWWGVDLGENKNVSKVVLYNRNDCSEPCARRLDEVNIYLGNVWGDYQSNPMVASSLDVPNTAALEVDIGAEGQYLFVARPGNSGMTLCQIQVYADTATWSPPVTEGGIVKCQAVLREWMTSCADGGGDLPPATRILPTCYDTGSSSPSHTDVQRLELT